MKKTMTFLVLIWVLVCTALSGIAESWQVFDGVGAGIIEDVTVESLPSRFYIRLSPAGELKINYLNKSTGESSFFIYNAETYSAAGILFSSGHYDFFIETTSNWVAVIEPIKLMDDLEDITANVSYVSNMFPINDPVIVKINAKANKACLFILNLYAEIDGTWEQVDSDNKYVFDNYETQKIFRTEQPTVGIYVVDFPNGEWEIKKK